jgi:hypothetical protein
MQTLISLLLSACLFSALYQFIAPKFSSGAVAFQPVPVGHKLLFGLAMSFTSQLMLFGLSLLASVTLVPLLVLLGVGVASAAPTAAVLAISATVLIVMLQLSNWFSTMVLGRLMPSILRVDSASAAFKAALAPTLVIGVFYLLMMFVLVPLLAVSN